MSIKAIYLDYILESISFAIGDMRGKEMLELGDQEMMDETIVEKTGKEYFEKRGVRHTSIDLNGLHGAIKVDLAKPIQNPEWQNHFDIITNVGTSEHVEPKKGQYTCFRNVHNLLKAGGIVIHLVPDIDELKTKGAWKNYSFNYYSHAFFEMLAICNNYKLISLRIIDGLICACLQKQLDKPFMEDSTKFLRYISRDSSGIIYPGINDREPILKLKYFFQKIQKIYYIQRAGYYIKHPMRIPGMMRRKWIRYFIQR